MAITEPMTVATDYLLAAIAIFLGWSLWALGRRVRQSSTESWGKAMLATAAAAIAGGTWHGFHEVMPPAASMIAWKTALLSIGVASFFMLAAAIMATIPRIVGHWLLAAAVLKLIVFVIWMLGHDEFVWVIYDYGSAMVFVLAVYVYRMIFSNDAAARAIVAGVLISFGAAWIQQSDLSVGTLFNHNDLYHLTQIAALFVFHSGAQRIRED
jgi:hypothetical protein